MKSEELFKRVIVMRKMGEYAAFYLDLLNQIVLKIKKPFTDIEYEDLIPFLREIYTSSYLVPFPV